MGNTLNGKRHIGARWYSIASGTGCNITSMGSASTSRPSCPATRREADSQPAGGRLDEDPQLAETKVIAEAWDAGGAYGGQLSATAWAEWNGLFRDDVRGFGRGDPAHDGGGPALPRQPRHLRLAAAIRTVSTS